MVHVRTIGDKSYTFIVSGKLWRNSLIMQDEETGSLWSHITGVALHGKLKGQQVQTLPSVQTTWRKWVAAHPKTLVLKKSQEVTGSRYQKYFEDPKRVGIIRTGLQMKKLPAKEMIHGVRLGDHALAVPDQALAPGSSISIDLGPRAIVVVRDEDGGVRAYIATVNGRQGEEIPVRQAFWFAWLSFFPDTEVFSQG